MLYYTVGFVTPAPTQANPNPPACSASATDTLYQVDPTSGITNSGVSLTVSGSAINGFIGSSYVGGTLYGFSTGQEYTVNTITGVATPVASTTVPIVGAGSGQ
jgi:hypothetical protein